jgi:hypothetical protein
LWRHTLSALMDPINMEWPRAAAKVDACAIVAVMLQFPMYRVVAIARM